MLGVGFQNDNTHYEMMVYVQYDRHVQQAIDEQVLIRCNPDERVVVKASMSQPRHDPVVTETTEPPARPLVKAARSVTALLRALRIRSTGSAAQ